MVELKQYLTLISVSQQMLWSAVREEVQFHPSIHHCVESGVAQYLTLQKARQFSLYFRLKGSLNSQVFFGCPLLRVLDCKPVYLALQVILSLLQLSIICVMKAKAINAISD